MPVAVIINAFFAAPQSAKRKTWIEMIRGVFRPTKKPDADNIGKIVCDALNGLAYHDDAQVVDLHVRKFWYSEPRVEVIINTISEIEREKGLSA